MSDTPRTDALVERDKPLDNLCAHNEMLDHARALERELAEAQRAYDLRVDRVLKVETENAALAEAARGVVPFLLAEKPVNYLGDSEAWNARARFLWLVGEPDGGVSMGGWGTVYDGVYTPTNPQGQNSASGPRETWPASGTAHAPVPADPQSARGLEIAPDAVCPKCRMQSFGAGPGYVCGCVLPNKTQCDGVLISPQPGDSSRG